MKSPRIIGTLAILLLALCVTGIATAQTGTVSLTVNKTVADGKLIPVLTWTSSPSADGVCVAGGSWSGTKAGAGTETLAEISATKSYKLTCTWPSMTGTATVSWTAPTTNTDGSALTNLKGYLVLAGSAPDALSQTTVVNDPAATSKAIGGLAAGTWYFGVVAVNTNDAQSAISNVATKLVGAPSYSASSTVTVTIRPVPSAPVLTTVVVAGVNVVPVFRLNAEGTGIVHTPWGFVPVGRACGAKVTTWRGKAFHRVTVKASEVWPVGSSTERLAAPCA